MYEELFGTPIDQIVILMASEDGGRVFIKDKAEYLPELEKAIQHFYKYYKRRQKAQSHNGLLKRGRPCLNT